MAGITDNMPPQSDDPARKQRDLERQAREQASARSGQAMQIGVGGITINGGGSLTIEGSGSLNVGSGSLNSAGSISAATTVTAGGTITGGAFSTSGAVSCASLGATGNVAAGGDVSASGRVISAGIINSPGSRAFQTTVGYVSTYQDSNGDFGFAPSTRASKQDMVPWAANIDSFMGIGTTKFRYKAAVAQLGEAAAVETGLVADDFVTAGLSEFTFNDPETGELAGLAYERLSVILWSVVQQQETRIRALEEKLSGADH